MGKKQNIALRISMRNTLILNGDMPLVRSQTLKKLCENPSQIVMSILHLDNPNGYGRVILEHNKVQKIIEQKDATQE